eukprot:TRINITY_DN3055_c0_g1_i1.p1 TRINITY_DN3055_c0_g1~~TRINITY_DN3055_c0_g1_i1.p1  ORF type:complete len:517 (-),score=72.55 TRINITY_DN3055_c0_g1_i1:48-1598(-)
MHSSSRLSGRRSLNNTEASRSQYPCRNTRPRSLIGVTSQAWPQDVRNTFTAVVVVARHSCSRILSGECFTCSQCPKSTLQSKIGLVEVRKERRRVRQTQLLFTDTWDTAALTVALENDPVMAAFTFWWEGFLGSKNVDELAYEWDIYFPYDKKLWSSTSEWSHLDEDTVLSILAGILIGHGSVMATVMKTLPFFDPHTIWKKVRDTSLANQGGIPLFRWVWSFFIATESARHMMPRGNSREVLDNFVAHVQGDLDHITSDLSLRGLAELSRHHATMVSALIGSAARGTGFNAFFDLKNQFPGPLLPYVVEGLNNYLGITVTGFGSFSWSQAYGADLSRAWSDINSQTHELRSRLDMHAVYFVHEARQVAKAVEAKAIRDGEPLMFNGGSVLDLKWEEDGTTPTYVVNEEIVAELRRLQKDHKLQLGIYTQEADLNWRAAKRLVEWTNDEPELLPLGFQYGGLRGIACDSEGMQPRRGLFGLLGKDRKGMGGQQLVAWSQSFYDPTVVEDVTGTLLP